MSKRYFVCVHGIACYIALSIESIENPSRLDSFIRLQIIDSPSVYFCIWMCKRILLTATRIWPCIGSSFHYLVPSLLSLYLGLRDTALPVRWFNCLLFLHLQCTNGVFEIHPMVAKYWDHISCASLQNDWLVARFSLRQIMVERCLENGVKSLITARDHIVCVTPPGRGYGILQDDRACRQN